MCGWYNVFFMSCLYEEAVSAVCAVGMEQLCVFICGSSVSYVWFVWDSYVLFVCGMEWRICEEPELQLCVMVVRKKNVKECKEGGRMQITKEERIAKESELGGMQNG